LNGSVVRTIVYRFTGGVSDCSAAGFCWGDVEEEGLGDGWTIAGPCGTLCWGRTVEFMGSNGRLVKKQSDECSQSGCSNHADREQALPSSRRRAPVASLAATGPGSGFYDDAISLAAI